ncbi:MAG: (d)CMP kinase [Defluviitaleaceae bacterium]|nr:(d)CMP kinase [Defluviitaleaceae bacterium]MCL2261908.1 (d)CMP kinase [Defluviitaleaceae bacterium]
MKKGFAIAIDGPGGVGKSTAARLVAQELGMAYIDTGAMYRAVALYQIENGINMYNDEKLERSLKDIALEIVNDGGVQKILLNGRDVTDLIRTQEVSEGASVVAANLRVREKLVAQQKQMAAAGRVVMDGRDIGTHVLPWAQIKIYLDAPPEIRAQRRVLELEEKGQPEDYKHIYAGIVARDKRDRSRKHNPLIQAEDAVYLSTAQNESPKDTARDIVNIYEERGY